MNPQYWRMVGEPPEELKNGKDLQSEVAATNPNLYSWQRVGKEFSLHRRDWAPLRTILDPIVRREEGIRGRWEGAQGKLTDMSRFYSDDKVNVM